MRYVADHVELDHVRFKLGVDHLLQCLQDLLALRLHRPLSVAERLGATQADGVFALALVTLLLAVPAPKLHRLRRCRALRCWSASPRGRGRFGSSAQSTGFDPDLPPDEPAEALAGAAQDHGLGYWPSWSRQPETERDGNRPEAGFCRNRGGRSAGRHRRVRLVTQGLRRLRRHVVRVDPATRARSWRRSRWAVSWAGSPANETGVWVSAFGTGELVRIDPGLDEVAGRVAVGGQPTAIAFDTHGSVWVGISAASWFGSTRSATRSRRWCRSPPARRACSRWRI